MLKILISLFALVTLYLGIRVYKAKGTQHFLIFTALTLIFIYFASVALFLLYPALSAMTLIIVAIIAFAVGYLFG